MESYNSLCIWLLSSRIKISKTLPCFHMCHNYIPFHNWVEFHCMHLLLWRVSQFCFSFGNKNNAVVNIHKWISPSLSGQMFQLSWIYISKSCITESHTNYVSTSEELSLFPKWPDHYSSLPAIYGNTNCSTLEMKFIFLLLLFGDCLF